MDHTGKRLARDPATGEFRFVEDARTPRERARDRQIATSRFILEHGVRDGDVVRFGGEAYAAAALEAAAAERASGR